MHSYDVGMTNPYLIFVFHTVGSWVFIPLVIYSTAVQPYHYNHTASLN